jgi:hypothetical protein
VTRAVRTAFDGGADLERAHWQSAIIVAVGLWLIGATFYTDDVSPTVGSWVKGTDWNFIFVGGAFFALAIASVLTWHRWEAWALLAMSLWLAISPWVLGYAGVGAYLTTALAAAAIVAVISGVAMLWHGGTSRS